MNIFHSLIFLFFLSALQDGNAVTFLVYTGVEGADVTLLCPLPSPGTEKFFCKDECKDEDVLIETRAQRAQSGRYRFRSHEGGTVSLTITQLMKSDSGMYRCGLGSPQSSVVYKLIKIIVVDALLHANHDPSKEKPLSTRTGRNITVRCLFNVSGSWKFFCKNQCEEKDILSETHGDTAQRGRYRIKYLSFPAYGYLYVTIAQLTTSDSGRYWCGVDKSYLGFDIIVTEDSTMLYAGVPLLITALLLPVVVLIFCRWGPCKPKDEQMWTSKRLKTRGKRDGQNTQVPLYENDPQAFTGEDSVYLSLHPATRDLDQNYSTLTHEAV